MGHGECRQSGLEAQFLSCHLNGCMPMGPFTDPWLVCMGLPLPSEEHHPEA